MGKQGPGRREESLGSRSPEERKGKCGCCREGQWVGGKIEKPRGSEDPAPAAFSAQQVARPWDGVSQFPIQIHGRESHWATLGSGVQSGPISHDGGVGVWPIPASGESVGGAASAGGSWLCR